MERIRVLRLRSVAFGTEAACLGSHVAAVVGAIGGPLPELCWYAADVECTGIQFVSRRSPVPVRVGDTDSMRRAAHGVQQFTSGVFVGVPPGHLYPRFRQGGLWTDDDELADLGDALVEVRAFDTTYISVASAHEQILCSLEALFETG